MDFPSSRAIKCVSWLIDGSNIRWRQSARSSIFQDNVGVSDQIDEAGATIQPRRLSWPDITASAWQMSTQGGSWVDGADMVGTLQQERKQMFFCLLSAIVEVLIVVTMTIVSSCSLIRCRSSWAGGIHPHLLRSLLPLLPLHSSHPLSPSLFVLPPIFPSPSVPPSSRPSVPLYPSSVSLCISVSLRVSVRVSLRVSLCVSLSVSLSLCLCVSVSLSFLCLCRSFCLSARCTRDRVLRQRLSASLFGVSIDGSDSPSTDAEDHTSCVVRALILPQTTQSPHVYYRQKTGLSPLTRTRSWTWSFLKRSHFWTHRLICLTSFTSEHHDPQNCRNFSLWDIKCGGYNACSPSRQTSPALNHVYSN